MGPMWNDKRIRQLAIAVLVVILTLGLLSLVSTVFQMIVPLALVIGGAFAFYKIVLEGRDAPDAVDAMEDELAESSGLDAGDAALETARADADDDEDDEDESAALERLSAAERAQSDFLDSATPAEEILDQIRARTKRLHGDDDA